jgi:hypothetical protein
MRSDGGSATPHRPFTGVPFLRGAGGGLPHISTRQVSHTDVDTVT